MKTVCIVDRIENGIAVLVPDDGSPVREERVEKYPFLASGEAAVYEDGKLRPAEKGEREDRRESNAQRLEKLFRKNKE